MGREFSINIRGRVKNFNLPKNQPLIPLFEAVVNSIHAIEERRKTGEKFEPKITIRLLRSQQIALEGTEDLLPIESFEIVDNGIGFDENNMASFMESDSTYKADIGGKGVGRFSWLIAFERAEIESIYREGDNYVQRTFEFSTVHPRIDDVLVSCGTQEDNQTTIRLLNCLKPYADNLPKRGSTIAMHIIQHCLVYFIGDNCPEIELIDIDGRYSLNTLFKDKIQVEGSNITICLGDKEFELLHVKAEEITVGGNKLYLCAHNRLVETKELEKYITNLDREIYEKCRFWYVGVLRGKYLDDSVDMNRLSFNIPDGGSLESMSNITTMDQIMKAVVVEIEKFLQDYLKPIATRKQQRIQEYVVHEAPQFRHLLKYMAEDIDGIKPNLSNDKLDDELHRIKRKFDRGIKDEHKSLLDSLQEGILSSEEYKERFERQVEKISSANSAVLAEYIAHRRVILDLMAYAMGRCDDGHFQKESFLHNLIYPMRKTAEDISYGQHNLWLIDERLAYCDYISSDIAFNSDSNQQRSDILVLDRPVAVSDEENVGTEYQSIVVFELKRPMRDDYTDGENPITQLYNYVRILKSGAAKDKRGRTIRVGSNTQFYLYAICDVTKTLERVLDNHDFTRTPDGLGFYRYNEKMNAYVEVLSYDKVIADAKKRNKVLFDKLGL